MLNFRKASFTICLIAIAFSFSLAQTTNPWKFISEAGLTTKSQKRQITPQNYLTASLDVKAMKAMLAKSPLWHTEDAEKVTIIVELPMPDGNFQRFRIYEAPVMHPDLQAQFPDIRSYAGIGIEDPTAYFRGDFTLRGFHGMVSSSAHSTVFIDPYSTEDLDNYQVYYRKDSQKTEPWACHFDEIAHDYKPAPADPAKMAGDCVFRNYRLALACTGEYAAFHGGTVPLVASAMTTTMTRVNGVFEREVSVRMTIVGNNNNIIFLNAATDPYTNTDGVAMLGQNQTTCDNNAFIGSANYDIGHVFSTGGGGVAGLGVVCSNGNKARGVTGSGAPIGDAFDIDYVAHEMGHQFAGNHTFNSNASSCCGGNRNASTAYEPGSGSTIMSYAGICSPTNVQPNSDDYFHAISVQEMASFVTGSGNSCSVNSNVNSAPTASAGLDYTIPRSTPFLLTGVGTDPNPGDVLTYTWEQMDLGAASGTSPTSTQTTGPVFRSFKGTTNTSRYLPRLVDVANNVSPTWEVLPSVARTLNFRLTVRDNKVGGGGCTAEDNMVVTVNGTAGPFLVTSPNTAVSWAGGSLQTITWDVASTNTAPVNCANVDVLMSVDGGLTYPFTLLVATPNDGSQIAAIPNVATTQARIMVRANGNVFYDISNANFTVTTGASSFSVTSSPTNQTVCKPTSAVYTLTLASIGGFSGSVNLSATDLPAGAVATFSPSSVVVPGTTTLTIQTTNAATGSFNPLITGVSGALTINRNVALTVNATPGSPSLTLPVNNAPSITTSPTFTWGTAANASTYQLQVSTSSSFPSTVIDATGLTATSYAVTSPLIATTTYFWRVRGVSSCNGPWSAIFSFTTGCTQTTASTNVPIVISGSGTPTVTSTLTLAGVNGNIIGLRVKDLKIHHTWIGDVKATLKSPGNVDYVLFDRPGSPATADGCSQNHILATFDDAALLTAAQLESTCNSSTLATPPPYAINGTYQPVTALAGLNGTSPNGTWTLTIQDFVGGDGGSLQTWSLELITDCTANLGLTQTFVQGYMNGSAMRPVLQNSGVAGANGSQCDTITVALHSNISPYAEAFSKKTVLSITGTAAAAFPPSTVGKSYYLVIKGRNLLETWSATPIAFSFSPTYNFGSAGQAYGGNLGIVGGIPVIYSGDIDSNNMNGFGDREIEFQDFDVWGAENGNVGYVRPDLDGDGEVNFSDFDIWVLNNGIGSIFP
ncbi:MAG: proprotein convertase P-domain-containing protein [Saprospiraceae bacterium]|nr:proprotein convertase P-domain-containing protein [Saprospiraceae bacterium]